MGCIASQLEISFASRPALGGDLARFSRVETKENARAEDGKIDASAT